MSQITRSATELSRVLAEPNGFGGTDVWLRRDIIETEEDGQPIWCADEAHALVPHMVTAGEVEADFEAWWQIAEEASATVADKLARLEAQVAFTALMTDTEV